MKERRGFTLIEVLVVVAIMALLVAILLPSLRQAREQAKIAADKANIHQIGIAISTYRAEFRSHVPIVLNTDANNVEFEANVPPGGPTSASARNCWLSIALRNYTQRTSKLPTWLPPADQPWNDDQFRRYQNDVLPDFYVCPFVRGRGDHWELTREKTITGPGGTVTYNVWQYQGRHESYVTWKWDGLVIRNTVPINGNGSLRHPLDPCTTNETCSTIGRPKYAAFSWNKIRAEGRHIQETGYDRFIDDSYIWKRDARCLSMHRQWGVGEFRRIRSAGPSDTTISYCAQGEWLGREPPSAVGRDVPGLTGTRELFNEGSHRTAKGGGTNALFVDGHVEWVEGGRIGWE